MLLAPLAPAQAAPPVDPNTMKVEGVTNNMRITTSVPNFSWTFPGTGTQTNWQIEVDDDLNFTMPLWFWESGTLDKGALSGATSAKYADPRVCTNNPSGCSLPVDSRAYPIYWRLRVQENNDPNWAVSTTNFVVGAFKRNQIPLPATSFAATQDGNPGTASVAGYPPLNPAPREFFTSPSGSDTNAGTMASPFRTVNRAIRELAPGDTLSLRAGTYRENVRIVPGSGARSGQPGNPIRIRSFPGETAIIDGPAAGNQPFACISFVGSPTRISHWTLEDLTLKGSGIQVGVFINNASSIIVKRLAFDPGFSAAATGVQMVGGGEDNAVLDSLFNRPMFDHIDVAGSRNVQIRENEFSNFNNHTCIQIHNNAGEGAVISDNVFHDGLTGSGAVSLYLTSDGAVARNNVFYDIRNGTGGLGAAFLILRSGKVLIENNTIVRCDLGVIWGHHGKLTTVRNNIFVQTGTALSFELAGSSPDYQLSSSQGTSFEHNFFFNNSRDLRLAYALDAAVIAFSGNCPLAIPLTGGSSDPNCDPKFMNMASDDFRLLVGSPAIDAADPNLLSPVPIGGGAVRDVGALEAGALGGPPYEYQPRATLADRTPRFTWAFTDPDNLLNAFDPILFPGTDAQGGFELQVDTLGTFDSINGSRPLFSSGLIQSASQGYTLPDTSGLPPGDYYVRVRSHDEHQIATGAWSHTGFRVRISSEPQAPVLTQQSPAPGTLGVSPGTSVSAHVVDFGVGVDSTTIEMRLGGDPNVIATDPNTIVSPQISQVGTTAQEFVVSFTPSPSAFPSGGIVYVLITAADLDAPPNVLNDPPYSFTLADSVAPAAPAGFMVVP